MDNPNRLDLAKFLTVIEEPGFEFVDFIKLSDEKGITMAEAIYNDVILPSESIDTLLAVGSGNLISYINRPLGVILLSSCQFGSESIVPISKHVTRKSSD